jgi:hypothetical protein
MKLCSEGGDVMTHGTKTIERSFTPVQLNGIRMERIACPKLIIQPFRFTNVLSPECPQQILQCVLEVFVSACNADQLVHAKGYGDIDLTEFEQFRNALVIRKREAEMLSSDGTWRLSISRMQSELFVKGMLASHYEKWIYTADDELFSMMIRDPLFNLFFSRLDFAFVMAVDSLPELIQNIAQLETEIKLLHEEA